MSITVHQDTDCLMTIAPLERWENRKLYEAYTRWRAERGDFETLSAILDQPLKRRFLDHVNV